MIRNSLFGELWAFAALIVLMVSCSRPVNAQLKVIAQPTSVEEGEPVNVFFRYDSREAVTGVLSSIPTGWTVLSAWKRSEKGEFLALSHERTKDKQIRIWGDKNLRFGDVIYLSLRALPDGNPSSVSVQPFIKQGSNTLLRESTSIRLPPSPLKTLRNLKNRVAEFGPDVSPSVTVEIPTRFQPSNRDPYTISTWIRTSSVNSLVLSTWTGNPEDNYAVEWVIDPVGYLEFYRGYNSKHVSMRSNKPVSDGNWHFLTLMFDPANHWTRMAVDGEVVDSLFHPNPLPSKTIDRVSLGGRLSATALSDTDVFQGQMDLFRISKSVWNRSKLKAEMKRRTPNSDFILDFESEADRRFKTKLSDFNSGRLPIPVTIQLADQGVRLEWTTTEKEVLQFKVERSFDGIRFGQVAAISAVKLDPNQPFGYEDIIEPKGVVYYRITPVYPDGPGDSTPILKIGLGQLATSQTVMLEGNFPNPFNPTTNISYEVTTNQHIRLSIWDLSGQLVSVLVDGVQSAGRYQVPFTAQELPSGTYFVRLVSESGILTHKMLLMK